MHKIIFILLGLKLIASCKSSDEKASSTAEAVQETTANLHSPEPAKPEAEPDLSQIKLCTMEYNPTRCYFTEYKKEELTENSRIFGWGLNPCSAKNSLDEEVIKLSLNPGDFSQPVCSPDVSQGACSDILRDCKVESGTPPMVCKITNLSGKSFRDDEVVQVLTSKTCDAKTLAKLELCKRNLYRKDLRVDIQCVQAPDSLQACGNDKFETCPNTYSPKICELVLQQDLSATNRQLSFARNECLARKILERRLCFMASNTEIQQKVTCRSPD